MNSGDFDDLKDPSRKPWLVIILVAVACIFLFQSYSSRRSSADKPAGHVQVPRSRGTDAPSHPATNTTQAVSTTANQSVPSAKQSRPSGNPAKLLDEAKLEVERGDLLKARGNYLQLHKEVGDAALISEVENALGRLNVELVTTPRTMPEKVEYVVKKGDSIDKIARKCGTTVELIQKSNNLSNPNLIKAGDYLRIFTGKFAITISNGRNELVARMNDEFFKRYSVATGKFGKTPVGTFVITDEKIKEPPWWRPGGEEIPFGSTNNILGTRWMAIRATGATPDVKGYGIHGTWDDNSIGKAESAGCIRMRNVDVEELFMLLPPGTPVTITE